MNFSLSGNHFLPLNLQVGLLKKVIQSLGSGLGEFSHKVCGEQSIPQGMHGGLLVIPRVVVTEGVEPLYKLSQGLSGTLFYGVQFYHCQCAGRGRLKPL